MRATLDHVFVEAIPETLQPGTLYLTINYATMAHLCACGCGAEVFTPLSPTDWRFDYDGETVSVWPSIGSWSLPCRSHYIIDRGRVRVAGAWSEERIDAGRARDRDRKAERYAMPFGEDEARELTGTAEEAALSTSGSTGGALPSMFARLVQAISGATRKHR